MSRYTFALFLSVGLAAACGPEGLGEAVVSDDVYDPAEDPSLGSGSEEADAENAQALAIPTAPNTVVVDTVGELLSALAAATPGSVVYVADTATLNLTGKVGIRIPPRVTLASGRGRGSLAGALLYTTQLNTLPLLTAGGEGVRITGLRLRGPDTEIRDSAYGLPLADGIKATRAPNLQVDHSELWGWSHAAIFLDYSPDDFVHHNYIHHNRRNGLGYGVCHHHGSTSIVEHNTFNYNRHAIAGTGLRDISYEARYNLVNAGGNGHSFDMHGENEALDNGAPYAGHTIRIHHNSFRSTTLQGVVIRGRPYVGAYINNNCFAQSSASRLAVVQRYFTGNMFVSSNSYSNPSGTCHLAAGPSRSKSSDVNGDGMADLVTLYQGSVYVYLGSGSKVFTAAPTSFAGTMKTALYDGVGHLVLDIADVDGDGSADLVSAHDNGTVYVYKGAPGGTFSGGAVANFGGTFRLASATVDGHEPIAVADVNGDGYGDLVSVYQGTVYTYFGRSTGGFSGSASSFAGTFNSAAKDGRGHFAVGVADVTGDGRADLVSVVDSGTAYVFPGLSTGAFGGAIASFAGTLNIAFVDGVGHEPVAVADVTGDGRADLVTVSTDGTAYVFPGASSGKFGGAAASFGGSLATSLFSGTGHEIIGAFDVTGDRRADLVTASSTGVVYVYAGTSTGQFSGGVANFGGTFVTSRFNREGHEPLVEKSLLRRRGCKATGCF